MKRYGFGFRVCLHTYTISIPDPLDNPAQHPRPSPIRRLRCHFPTENHPTANSTYKKNSIHPFFTKKVTNLKGIKQLNLSAVEVGEIVSSTFAEMVFVHGFVHCDPHPGNIFVRRRLSKKSVSLLSRYVVIFLGVDPEYYTIVGLNR